MIGIYIIYFVTKDSQFRLAKAFFKKKIKIFQKVKISEIFRKLKKNFKFALISER